MENRESPLSLWSPRFIINWHDISDLCPHWSESDWSHDRRDKTRRKRNQRIKKS